MRRRGSTPVRRATRIWRSEHRSGPVSTGSSLPRTPAPPLRGAVRVLANSARNDAVPAGLDQGEWADYVDLVRARTGLELADTEQVDLS